MSERYIKAAIHLREDGFMTTPRAKTIMRNLVYALLLIVFSVSVRAQEQPAIDVNQKLAGFDEFMAKTLKDWNAPGIGVGVVVGDKLVFAKGYGYRDYEKKLPITAQTLSSSTTAISTTRSLCGICWHTAPASRVTIPSGTNQTFPPKSCSNV
jgi:CubicO group peptidase (beta-lactamase class C family)